ncbi:MAG: 2-phospho-L-lactate transferase, partial [Polyangiales bacterium]
RMTPPSPSVRVVALAGGVGGARLVHGLDRVLPSDALEVVVNTGDDFNHWGLRICPDLDTVMYTLAGLSPEERGWGVEGDSFKCLEEAARRDADAWFQLGDRDLVTHILRTEALRRGESLTEVTSMLCLGLGVHRPVLPMCDLARPTIMIATESGARLAFQDWLVRMRAEPSVREVLYEGTATASDSVLKALRSADLVVICPSNPYVSIDPILSLDGVRTILQQKKVVAVSPLLGGKAVKGPLATMVTQLDRAEPTAEWVAAHYADVLDGFVLHEGDTFSTALSVLETNILIQKQQDRVALAREVLDFARTQL